MSNKKPRKTVDPNESGQEKFRRVVGQRLSPLVARYEQIKNMIGQPSYNPSTKDLKHLQATLNEYHNECNAQIQKGINGTLKAEEIKKFSGIDWEKELEDTSEEQ